MALILPRLTVSGSGKESLVKEADKCIDLLEQALLAIYDGRPRARDYRDKDGKAVAADLGKALAEYDRRHDAVQAIKVEYMDIAMAIENLEVEVDDDDEDEEQAPCDGCGKSTPRRLLDGKDDGTGNYTILHCEECYGPGWSEM